MNYFEFYGIPVSFHPDQEQVRQKFYELSRTHHPDFYAGESEQKQQEALELSTLNNQAYKVLSDPLKRIEYILQLHGLVEEGDKYQLPQEFLMEMMEVNEQIMELQLDPDAAKLEQLHAEINIIESQLFADLKIHTDAFDEQQEQGRLHTLEAVRDIWYRQKYLARIRESLQKIVI